MLRPMSVAESSSKAEKPISRAAMVMPVYVPSFLLSFGQGVLVPTLPVFAKGFGVSFSLVSLVVAAAGLGTLAADLPAGLTLGRLGRQRAMLIGISLVASTMLVIALWHQFTVLLICRLLGGVGAALWGISRHAYITAITPRSQRGKFIATFGGINRVGLFAGPFIGGVVGHRFGLSWSFALAAIFAALAAPLAVIFIRDPRERVAVVPPRHLRWESVRRLMRTHRADVVSAGAAQIFAAMIRSGRQLIIPLYGVYALNLDVASIGTIVTISTAIDMLMFIPAGWVMDRFGRKVASVPSFAIMAAGVALIPLASNFLGLFIATSVIGFGNGIGSGSMMTLGADLAPPDAVGEFLGVWRFIGDAGSAGGPLVVGIIADALGLATTAFVLAGIGVIAALILSVLVRETLQAEPQAQAP
ncbi:MAG: MFS transporter [Thermomicrobiales bacterium]